MMNRRLVVSLVVVALVGGGACAASAANSSALPTPSPQQVCVYFDYGAQHTDRQALCLDA